MTVRFIVRLPYWFIEKLQSYGRLRTRMLSGPVGRPSAFHYDAESLCMSVFKMDEDPKWKKKLCLQLRWTTFESQSFPFLNSVIIHWHTLLFWLLRKAVWREKETFLFFFPLDLSFSTTFPCFRSRLRFRRTNFFATQLFTHIRLIPFEQFRL